MNLSVLVVGATLLAGQAGPSQSKEVISTSPTVIQSRVISTSAPVACCDEPCGFLARLKARLMPSRCCTSNSCCSSSCCSSRESGMPQMAMTSKEPVTINQVSAQTKSVETGLKPEYNSKVGSAEDYSWVTGQLFYLHAAGQGFWVVRYASVDQEDKYGGSVILAGAANMKNFREGDLICVHGEVLNEGRATKFFGGPLYRAQVVEMVDRSDP